MKQFLRFLTSFVVAYVEKYDKFHFNNFLRFFGMLFQNYVDFALVVRGKVTVVNSLILEIQSGEEMGPGD